MKEIKLCFIVVVALSFSFKSTAQIHTFPWDPSSITSEQKKFIDSCKKYMYDTLGNEITSSSSFDFGTAWLEGDYIQLIEIDSAAHSISWKWRKATEKEQAKWKAEILNERSISSIIGTQISNMSLTDLNGTVYQTAKFDNKIVYLNFWFVGCQPCEQERVKLNQLYKKYREKVVFLSISQSNERKTIGHLEKKEHLWPVAVMGKELKTNFPFVWAYPTNIILRNGKYEVALSGLNQGAFLVIEETLDRLIR